MDVKELTVQDNSTIKNVLEVLNNTGVGVVFVIDHADKIVGLLTDGDIRRALLEGKATQSSIDSIMNRSFVSLPVESDNSVILETLSNKVRIIPLVDSNGVLVDYASHNKIRHISVASPLLNGNELLYVTECIKTSWISSQGKYVRDFENLFTEYLNGHKSLAVSNGTVALHLALEALNIGKGDEVLVADFTFAASVNSILYAGAIPVLVDIETDTWNIDLEKAEKLVTSKTRAIMPVHIYGHPCDMDAIAEFAKKYNLLVIEDCAEALGSFYKDQPVGVFGDAATYSFYGNKTITTGEGGMVAFKDEKVAQRAAMLRDHGMEKTRRYWHAEVGYNYRLTNLQAAIGVAQFEKLEEFVSLKRNIAKTYNETLSKISYFQLPAEREDTVNSYWLYTFLVKPSAPFKRDDLIHHLSLKGIETRPVFFPIHEMPPYVAYGKSSDLQVSIQVSQTGMSLPSSVNLTESELGYICRAIESFANEYNPLVIEKL